MVCVELLHIIVHIHTYVHCIECIYVQQAGIANKLTLQVDIHNNGNIMHVRTYVHICGVHTIVCMYMCICIPVPV